MGLFTHLFNKPKVKSPPLPLHEGNSIGSISRFLPAGFDASRPIALLAGQREYPILVAQKIREAGLSLRLIAFEGETESSLWDSFPANQRASIKVGQVGHLLKELERFQAGYALMAGQITPGKLFHGLHPDLKAIRLLASLKERNAETIFGALAQEIQAVGTTLIDARSFLEDQLATAGLMTSLPLEVEQAHIEHGIHIAQEMARLDIGQGVVVRKGTVLAIEAFEGTDAMLLRAGSFKTKQLIFVKTVKNRQDWRFDVPVIGIKTLDTLQAAGITTVALQADAVLMLNKPKLIKIAQERGIRIWGYESSKT